MDHELAVAPRVDDRLHALRDLGLQWAAGSNDGDAHSQGLWMQRADLRNGGKTAQDSCRVGTGLSHTAEVKPGRGVAGLGGGSCTVIEALPWC